MTQQQILGQQAEQAALDYLQQHRLKIITRNFRCYSGEIDLIMRDKDTLVFVEVRLRTHPGYASALESVDSRKQQKLRKTAQYYLQQQQLTDKLACRFDVIAICYELNQPVFEWIQNAF